MDKTVQALKALYVTLGGKLTDTYSDIADGAAVSDYTKIPDVINAMAELTIPAALPTVTAGNAGQVLTVSSEGEWVADDVPSELPSVDGSDEGKALIVSNDGEWVADTIPSQLPTVTADDNGDVLTVADGVWAAVTPTP